MGCRSPHRRGEDSPPQNATAAMTHTSATPSIWHLSNRLTQQHRHQPHMVAMTAGKEDDPAAGSQAPARGGQVQVLHHPGPVSSLKTNGSTFTITGCGSNGLGPTKGARRHSRTDLLSWFTSGPADKINRWRGHDRCILPR